MSRATCDHRALFALQEGATGLQEREARGEIELNGLGLRYGADLPLLYRNVNLRIDAGEMITIMGPNGCGKSTQAKLMLGFYRPTEGQIEVDGVDVTHLSANELRANFGVVPQETHIRME